MADTDLHIEPYPANGRCPCGGKIHPVGAGGFARGIHVCDQSGCGRAFAEPKEALGPQVAAEQKSLLASINAVRASTLGKK